MAGISLSTVIKIIIQYIGTGGLGGIPLMPNLGIKVQGMPPMTAALPGGLASIAGLASIGIAGLSGKLAGLSSLSGLAGIAGLSGVAGNLGGIVGNISGLSNIAGNLGGLGGIAGNLGGIAGNLGGLGGIAGNLSGLSGNLAGLSGISGNLSSLSNLSGNLGNLSSLAGNLGGTFSNLSGVAQNALTGQFNNIISSAGLNAVNPFMNSPLGNVVGDINGTLNNAVSGLGIANIAGLSSSVGQFTSAMDLVKSTTDQLSGHPLGLINGLTNVDNLVLSAGAQSLSPAGLLGNLANTIAHAPDIAQVTKQVLSPEIFNLAQANINTLSSQISSTADPGMLDLLGTQLKTSLDGYTTQLQQQSSQFESEASRINSNINAASLMAAKLAPAGTNLSASLALLGQAYLTPNLNTNTLSAIADLTQTWANTVDSKFVEEIVPTLAKQAEIEANTTTTALTKLANSATNVVYNKGYPEGVNIRYG